MEAYTYLLIHKLTNRKYYGVRKSNIFDLFDSYFTSSKVVKKIIKEEGVDAFYYECRRTFSSYKEARLWETRVLQKMKVVQNSQFFNQAVSSPRICSKDSDQEIIRRQKISASMVLRWKNPEQRLKFTRDSSFYKEIGAMGHSRRVPKPPRRRGNSSKIISIEKLGNTRQITQNQLSAYRKYGWSMCKDS